jgi:hypothetical protein
VVVQTAVLEKLPAAGASLLAGGELAADTNELEAAAKDALRLCEAERLDSGLAGMLLVGVADGEREHSQSAGEAGRPGQIKVERPVGSSVAARVQRTARSRVRCRLTTHAAR